MEKDLSQGVGIDVQADASNMTEGEAYVLSISSTVPEGAEVGWSQGIASVGGEGTQYSPQCPYEQACFRQRSRSRSRRRHTGRNPKNDVCA